jgi:hypothetical protein
VLSTRLRPLAPHFLVVCLAGAFFWLSFDSGTYGLEGRTSLAIALWWAIIVLVGLRLCSLRNLPREALVALCCLIALAAITLASTAWASSAERAFTEFDRVSLYVGLFVAVLLVAGRSTVTRWMDAIALALTGVAVLSLLSRLFPDVFGDGTLGELLPSARSRLSYPVGYWNGLAILLGLAVPLLLRAALGSRSVWARALAITPFPVLAADIYLTSSRGGAAIAAITLVCFLGLTARRWEALATAALALAGAAGAVAALVPRTELVNGPLGRGAAVEQGREAAVLILLVCAGAALVYVLGYRYAPRALHPGPLMVRLGTLGLVLAALAGIAASDPVGRFETFRQPPVAFATPNGDFVKAHLLSGNGSGRWQFWEAAVDEFKTRPLLGRGAGSYEAWWAQHGKISYFVRDAHSLYLETLGELGVFGILSLLGAFGAGLVAIVRRIFRLRGDERVTLAALAAGFVGYAVAVGIDWMWELTVVSLVGITFLALITGPATNPASTAHTGHETLSPSRSRRHLVVGIMGLLAAWAVVCSQAIPLFVELKLNDSQAAAKRGDGDAALSAAAEARNIQPWAASPYVQLGLVQEQLGDLSAADSSIQEAIERDREDWRAWLIAARIEAKEGQVSSAHQSLAQAAALNPRSPLFASLR